MHLPDIDIDFADREKILSLIKHIPARLPSGKPHNTGIYCTAVPEDGLRAIAGIDHKQAEQRGYFKLDFLNVSLYENINDEAEILEHVATEPIWELLEHKEFTSNLFHIGNHSGLVANMKPMSVEQLAAVLAIIRPAKRYLADRSWDQIFEEVWVAPDDGQYYFKKSHSIGYALAIVVQMNKIVKELRTSQAS